MIESYTRPMHALAPPENGTKLSLSHSPMNLSGLKLNGSSQYRAAWFSVNHLTRPTGQGDWSSDVCSPISLELEGEWDRDNFVPFSGGARACIGRV